MNQYPNQPGGPHMPPWPGPRQQPASGLATASMVIGIIGLVVTIMFFWIPFVAQILPVISLIMGIVAKNQGNQSGAATAGIVLSIIALALGLFWMVSCLACFACADYIFGPQQRHWHEPWFWWW